MSRAQKRPGARPIKGQGKVYTNETLRGADGGEPPAPPPPPASTGACRWTTRSLRLRQEPRLAEARSADAAKDEKFWRDRLTDARDALARSQTFVDALQSQINGALH